MFYVLSKLIGIVISNPVFYCITLLLVALQVKRKGWRTACVASGLLILLLCSNHPLYYAVSRAWAAPYLHAWDSTKTYRYGIVLGGFAQYDRALRRIEFKESADRWIDAVLLYKAGKIQKLVIASDGSITTRHGKGNPEAMYAALSLLGIPRKDVILEKEALNTRENATLTIPLLGKDVKPADCLLITSAAHMRRSLAAFRKAGLEPVPYVVDIEAGPVLGWEDYIPDMRLLSDWQALIHEWIGSVAYKIAGY